MTTSATSSQAQDVYFSREGVRLHGTVVWTTAKQLVVSAGASVFSLALRGGTSAPSANGGLQPGDDLDLSADVKGGAGRARDGSQPPFYYSFDVANVHFVSLCTESAKTSGKQVVADYKCIGEKGWGQWLPRERAGSL